MTNELGWCLGLTCDDFSADFGLMLACYNSQKISKLNPIRSEWNLGGVQLLRLDQLELALALSVKRYTFPNDYTRSMKVNTAVELPVQETFQLCSAMHRSVTLLLLLSENWSSQQLNTPYISARSEATFSTLGWLPQECVQCSLLKRPRFCTTKLAHKSRTAFYPSIITMHGLIWNRQRISHKSGMALGSDQTK